MQKSIVLALLGCAAFSNAIETSLRSKLKNLAQLQAQQDSGSDDSAYCWNNTAPDCNLTAPELGDLSGDLLSWCPYTFGASNASTNLGSAVNQAASQSLQLNQF
jgi:hypothetical protein